jgi:hypothetical protein
MDGDFKELMGIVDQNELKVSNKFTFKLLNSGYLFLIEAGNKYEKKDFINWFDDLRLAIRKDDFDKIGEAFYLPFFDGNGSLGAQPDLTMMNWTELENKIHLIFTSKIKNAFLVGEVTGFDFDYEPDPNDVFAYEPILNPWEYLISINETEYNRSLTFVFSIKSNSFRIVRIQYIS